MQSLDPGTALGLGLVKTRPHAAVCGSSLAFVETQLSLEGGIAVTHYMLIISLSLSPYLFVSLLQQVHRHRDEQLSVDERTCLGFS